jgi:HSP20 family molecular chaperone IbpA
MSNDNRSIPVSVGRTAHAPASGEGSRINPAETAAAASRVYYTPLIDIHEGPDGLILEADLPGASEGAVSVQLEDNVLSLHARVDAPAPQGARALHEEYPVGDFFRSFILSDEVERGRITAELRNGVLRLNLPKAERAKTRRIEIKS